jgi:uncharacterized protein (DUF983 family)
MGGRQLLEARLVIEKRPLPKKPKGAIPIFIWWLKKLFWIGGRTVCPRCEKGQMFESFFKVRKRCPECKVVLQPYPGDELGVIALGYFMTVAPSLIGVVLAHFYTDWSGGQLLAFFLCLMTVILVGFYRNIKGIWIAFVYLLTGLRKRL